MWLLYFCVYDLAAQTVLSDVHCWFGNVLYIMQSAAEEQNENLVYA